jgi:hypothetical protein
MRAGKISIPFYPKVFTAAARVFFIKPDADLCIDNKKYS